MGKTREAKDRNNKRNNKKRKLGLKPKNKKQKIPIQDNNPALLGDGDDDDAPTPERVQRLLEPYTKDQLVGFLLDAAAADPALLARIRTVADSDISHRKIFVHGLGWDTSREALIEAFQPYGPIEDCNVVIDKATGRSKGFGFVLFKTRAGAVKALKEPQKKIKNRLTNSQFASIGPVSAGGSTGGPHPNAEGRRVYVSNVHADASSDKLKAFFAKFGEIEAGPFGFDMNTGKSRGFALFVYKTQEGALKALEEPYKMFEGHQLHCKKATDPSQKGKALAATAAVNPAALLGAVQQPMLAAVAAAQNLALYSQNPAYAALLGQNPLLAAAALNPAAAGLVASQEQVYGGAGIGGGPPSVLGAYGSQGAAGLQGLQSYQGSQFGQSSSARPGSSFGGYPPY